MKRRVIVACFAVAAMVSGGASLAWACTVAPTLSLRSLSSGVGAAGGSGPAGVVVVRPGEALEADVSKIDLVDGSSGSGQVEIRWGSLDGAVLAAGAGSSLLVPVTVPDTAVPGTHMVVAVARDRSGAVSSKVAKPVEVSSSGLAGSLAGSPWAVKGAAPASSGGSQSALTAAVALLGVGLVGLFAAVTVVVVGRRRATLSSPGASTPSL